MDKIQIHSKSGLKLSTYTKVKLDKDELVELRAYLKEYASYVRIKENTGLAYMTVKNISESGSGRAVIILKIREFLTKLKAEK